MSASKPDLLRAMFLVAVFSMVPAVADEPPEMELLEYLGSWEESDEDWVWLTEALDEDQVKADDTRSDPAAEDEESQENDHES